MSRWPDYLLIGAAKSGTTAVARYLQQHPDVFLTEPKEPRYFAFAGSSLEMPGLPKWMRREYYTDEASYLRLYAGAAGRKAAGEASVSYISEAGTAERIHARAPEVKILAILRDPVERAYSNFLFLRSRGLEPIADFEEALAAEERRKREGWISWFYYQGKGMYGEQLARYYRVFDRAQIRVWLYEDLKRDPAGLMREMFGFLGVDAGFGVDFSEKHNVTEVGKVAWVSRVTYGRRSLRWLARWNRAEKPAFPAGARERLRESFREDLGLAEELIGRDLSGWKRGLTRT